MSFPSIPARSAAEQFRSEWAERYRKRLVEIDKERQDSAQMVIKDKGDK